MTTAQELLEREQRRAERLWRAAFGVGHTHEWFVKLPRAAQEAKAREWVAEALDAHEQRQERRALERAATGARVSIASAARAE